MNKLQILWYILLYVESYFVVPLTKPIAVVNFSDDLIGH